VNATTLAPPTVFSALKGGGEELQPAMKTAATAINTYLVIVSFLQSSAIA
jgi:hypothetical protein